MKFISLFLTLLFPIVCPAQLSETDSLHILLRNAGEDSTKVNLLVGLSDRYRFIYPDSQFIFANEGLRIAQSINYVKGEIDCKDGLAIYWWDRGDYARALNYDLQILEYYKSQKDTITAGVVYSTLLNNYRDQGDFAEALHYGFLMMRSIHLKNDFAAGMVHAMIGSVYLGMNKYDSASFYLKKALNYPPNLGIGWIKLMNGKLYAKTGQIDSALKYYWESQVALQKSGDQKDLAQVYISLAEIYLQTGHTDSAVFYGNQGLNISKQFRLNKELLQSCLLLGNVYEKTDTRNALAYYKEAMTIRDSLYNQERLRTVFSYQFNEEIRKQEISHIEQQLKNKNRTYMLLALLSVFLLFAVFLVYNNNRKQKVNSLLKHQKAEIESTLATLKETQSQLIQQEKMASLGELTAGIAHEIQNPLNFVNNFSEVNKELIEELKIEQKKESRDYTNENEILTNLEQNLEKINQHGKRAEAIVKGMLQHSKAGMGNKELTDINALGNEYFRLCYNGLRSKDKSFNVTMQTVFDERIGKINIVPQDIGRVLLNLFGNAFYSVNEKKKKEGEKYEPIVSLSTKLTGNKIEIRIKDNGNGIPEQVLNKIFQPFFTTKPTGQGTGLGLSLSYDIVTKQHDGTIKAESREGEYAEFIIVLPE
jgi:two-component system, NtrC family, sensor kinase